MSAQATASIHDIWKRVDNRLKNHYTAASYECFLAGISPISEDGSVFTLAVADNFAIDAIIHTYLSQIEAFLHEETGIDYRAVLCNRATDVEVAKPSPVKKPFKTKEEYIHDLKVEALLKDAHMDFSTPREHAMTFDNFIAGDNSEFAYNAALAICDAPAYKYNPLFIYGASGLGKTHLLHAIGYKMQAAHPSWKILYTTTEKFTNDVIRAIKESSTHIIRDVFRTLDVLLVDDLQFIEGKETTQEEFFNTFNALKMAGKQIVITADRNVGDMPKLMERLRTRVEGGLKAEIFAPSFETRVAILRQKLENTPLENNISDEAINWIAEQIKDNIRELEGAAHTLTAYADMKRTNTVDISAANFILKSYMSRVHKRCTDSVDIIREVENFFNLRKNALLSSERKKDLVQARQIAMFLCRELTEKSLPDIGKDFGGRDHSTVLHSINKIKKEMEANLSIISAVRDIKEKLAE